MDARDSSDPLAPLDFGMFVITWLVGILLVLVLAGTVFGSGSFLGFGDDQVCATTRPGTVPYGGSDSVGEGDHLLGLVDGATQVPSAIDVCYPDAGPALRVGAAIGPAAGLGLLLGSLLLTRGLIRYARRTACSTPEWHPGRNGWAGSSCWGASWPLLFSRCLRGSCSARRCAARRGWWAFDASDFPVALVLVGLGAITVGRVLDRAVAIQDDADTTI